MPIRNTEEDDYPPLLKRVTRERYIEKVKNVSKEKKGCPLTILLLISPALILWILAQLILKG